MAELTAVKPDVGETEGRGSPLVWFSGVEVGNEGLCPASSAITVASASRLLMIAFLRFFILWLSCRARAETTSKSARAHTDVI